MIPQTFEKTNDAPLGYLLLRATLGVNILMHGLARLFSGHRQFAAAITQSFHATILPQLLVASFASSLPWIEAVIGALVLVGLFSRVSLTAGGLLILALTFGSSLRQDWEIVGLQLIYALVYAALIAFRRENRYSVDTLLARKR